MESCKTIRATGIPSIKIGDVVTRGSKGNIRILSCYPDPCVYTLGTRVIVVKNKEYVVKKQGKHVVIESRDGNEKYVYVYDVFEKVDKVVKELVENKPRRHGLLLAGAPGTGKSTLAGVIAELYGVSYTIVSPGDVRRKYLGESEKALRDIFKNAIDDQPHVIIFDDAEWLLSTRHLGEGEEENRIHNVLFTEFLKNFDSIVREGHRVLVIATTNKKVSELDPAVRRGGRFGDPIVFPLPDVDTIELLFKVYGVKADRKLIIKILNAGVEQSGIVNDIIPELKNGKEPRIKPRTGRGYKRMYIEPVEGVEKIFEYIPKDVFSKSSRFWIPYTANIALPIILNIVAAARKSCIVVSNLNYIEEVVPQANMYQSAILFPSGISPVVELYVDNNAENAVIFYNKKPPSVSVFPFFRLTTLQRILGVETLLKMFLNYLEIKLNEKEYNTVLNTFSTLTSDEEIEEFLNAITTLRTINDKILALI